MKTLLITAVIGIEGILAFWLGTRHPAPSLDIRSTQYEMIHSGATDRNFIFDRATGRVWRHYQNWEDGKPTTEGFAEIGYINFPDLAKLGRIAVATPTPTPH